MGQLYNTTQVEFEWPPCEVQERTANSMRFSYKGGSKLRCMLEIMEAEKDMENTRTNQFAQSTNCIVTEIFINYSVYCLFCCYLCLVRLWPASPSPE